MALATSVATNETLVCEIQTRTGARKVILMGGTPIPNRGFSGASLCLNPCGSTAETKGMAHNISAQNGRLTDATITAIESAFDGHGQEIISALQAKVRLGLPHGINGNGKAAK